MAFNHVTIGIGQGINLQNFNIPFDSATLTSLGLSLNRQALTIPIIGFQLGLTPPGDEDSEVYLTLCSGFLSPTHGAAWSGSIRCRESMFLVLNYWATAAGIIILTWTTTA